MTLPDEKIYNMKSTTLFIIRHGQTDWNLEDKIQGHIDIPLNAQGMEQAQQVASFLKKKNVSFKALYSSDLQRAHQTAQPIAATFSLNIITTPHLRERHVGDLQGLTKQKVRETHGEHFDFDWEVIPGGETKTDFLRRIMNQITLIAQAHVNENVVMVTHGHAIRKLLTFAGYDINEWPAIINASIITVRYHHKDTSEPIIQLISVEYVD